MRRLLRQLDIEDLLQTAPDGRGVINILAADRLINAPKVYSTFLLWLLSELFERLPEAGDLDRPRTVFFFDEAHLLFDDAPEALVDKIEQVVRLIRSKGVGVFFVTQNPADIPEPVASVDHLLMGKVPGLAVIPSTGLAGSGSKVRLRGSASVSLSNQPLVYVDGVRMRSDGYPENLPLIGERSRGPNDTPSPLNDIDPADIERVEVVRGPAAATLYGTEAAAGVIQIFTKRGVRGSPVWSTRSSRRMSSMPPVNPTWTGARSRRREASQTGGGDV